MIEFDDDRRRLDVARVHGWLTVSHWSSGIERALVERAVAGSRCLGTYEPLGFHAPIRPERYMERLHPEAAARLRALA